ncbi:DUF488 domain-containing protein [Pseudoxanthomonas sp. LARHCG66]
MAGKAAAPGHFEEVGVGDDELATTVWTIGHSTRTLDVFVRLLHHNGIGAIADVRRFPGSRRYPWFGSDAMAASLHSAGIAYIWLPQLGGRRRPRKDSPNRAWRNAAFQGYADHLASAEFAEGLAQVVALAPEARTAMMCAESLWWRCHRRLIADLLVQRGWTVLHVLDEDAPKPHPLNVDARIQDGVLVYPPKA